VSFVFFSAAQSAKLAMENDLKKEVFEVAFAGKTYMTF
jgi:hypothetical protein